MAKSTPPAQPKNAVHKILVFSGEDAQVAEVVSASFVMYRGETFTPVVTGNMKVSALDVSRPAPADGGWKDRADGEKIELNGPGTYRVRVLAKDTNQTSGGDVQETYSVVVMNNPRPPSKVTKPPVTTPSAPETSVETPSDSIKIPALGFVGIGGFPENRMKEVVKDQRPEYGRNWFSLNWNNVPAKGNFKQEELQLRLGITPIVCAAPEPLVDTDDAKMRRWWEGLASSLPKGCWVEAFNELDGESYNPGRKISAKRCVQMLAIAYDVLHKADIKVIGFAVSERAYDFFEECIKEGYLDHCDVVGFHGYGNNIREFTERLAQHKSMVKGKPIACTEFTLRCDNGSPDNMKAVLARNIELFTTKCSDLILCAWYRAEYVLPPNNASKYSRMSICNSRDDKDAPYGNREPFYTDVKNMNRKGA